MDLFDSMDKIAPILVFLLWIIISIFSQSKKNSQKKSRTQNSSTNSIPQYRKPAQTTTTSPYKEPQKGQQQTSPFEDLKRKLETIFNESLPADEEVVNTDEERQYKKTSTKQLPPDIPVEPESVSAEETLPDQMRFAKKKWYSHETSDAYSQAGTSIGQTPPAIVLSIEKLREGFILSEIIAQPVSLRDDRW
jgi:hypothetical protein